MRRFLAVVIGVLLVSGIAVIPFAGSAAPTIVVHKVDEAGFEPVSGTVFAVVVGADGREGIEGIRGDALHVLGMNPAEGKATILNIPRDTWVDIPGRGFDKITMAYYYGGPQMQADAVSRLTGVPISFVITTSFLGFQAMVDEVGGLVVDVPFDMNEPLSGAIFPAGPRLMDGGQALAFARNRLIPDGDLLRTQHQGQLLIYALAKVRAETTGPADTIRFLGTLARHTRLDGVSLRDLYSLGRTAIKIDPANVRNVTMPSRIGKVGPAWVVFTAPEAGALFEDFRDDAVLQTF